MNALTTPARGVSLEPRTFDEAMRFAAMIAKSTMVPRDFQNRPENVLVAVQWGREIGLGPLQALQNIAVINGRPSVWGDAALALVRGSGVCSYVREAIEGEGEAMVATCRAKRRDDESEVVSTFSVADAKKAGLWGKTGPWTQYPKRMLQLRARGFAIRDAFPDVLRGVITAEEAQDTPPRDTFTGTTIEAPAEARRAPPPRRQTMAEAIGDDLPPALKGEPPDDAMGMAPEPPREPEHAKRKTISEWLTDLEGALAVSDTADEVDVIVASPEVQKALDTLRNGARERLTAIIKAAQDRTADDGGAANEPAPAEDAA